ncbi:MAG: radical SAM protein [Thermoplasmata archaeon]|nr:radical SAM protein [Thermoplasmata archaeon]
MEKKKIFVYTSRTCIRRKLDARRIADYFAANGHEIIFDPRKADYIILVTCSDTNSRMEISLKYVKRFMKYKGELIVAGCLPGIDPDKLEEIFHGKTVVTEHLHKIDEYFPEHKIKFNQIPDANIPWQNIDESRPYWALLNLMKKSKTVRSTYKKMLKLIRNSALWKTAVTTWYGTFAENPYIIRTSWGCTGNCAYCAIKKAIGRLRSKPIEVILYEFKQGLKKGYKYFIFDADDIGGYGIDIGENLPRLLDAITSVPGDYTMDVHYIHPGWIVKYADELVEILKRGKIKRIGSSIQSGNPRILKLMHRYSNTDKMKEAYKRIKEAYPPLIIETESICGFPSETWDEFMDTLNFITEVGFDWGVIFPFSEKRGTEAEKIEPKVPQDEIMRRMKYAKKFLRKNGYDVRYELYLKSLSENILVYSKIK